MDNELEIKEKDHIEDENYCDFLKTYCSYENENNEEKVLSKAYESCMEEACSSLPFGGSSR